MQVVDDVIELCLGNRLGREDLFDLDGYIPAQCERGVRSGTAALHPSDPCDLGGLRMRRGLRQEAH